MPTDQRAHWNRIYSNNSNYFGQDPSTFGKWCFDHMCKDGVKKVLELGPGQGRDTQLFINANMSVVAADYSERSCRDLKDRFDDKVSVLHTDLKDGINLNKNSFDACYSHMLFTMDFTDSEASDLMKDIRSCVIPGGMIYFSVRNKNDSMFGCGENVGTDVWENNGFAVRFWSVEDIKRVFPDVEIECVKEFTEEGKTLFGVTIRNSK